MHGRTLDLLDDEYRVAACTVEHGQRGGGIGAIGLAGDAF